MLAYVFWHWKADSVEAERYERLARDFHASFDHRRPEGFLSSLCFAISKASWVPEDRPAYEDWYFLEGSAALDPLDRAAVSPPQQAPHDSIAGAVAGGAGGLYRLRRGAPLGNETRCAFWFRKPEGMTYPALYALLEPLTANGASALWGRQMVLGPAPEFCLHAPRALDLPAPLDAAPVPLRAVWP